MLIDHKFSEALARRNGRTQRQCDWYEEEDPMRAPRGILVALVLGVAFWIMLAIVVRAAL